VLYSDLFVVGYETGESTRTLTYGYETNISRVGVRYPTSVGYLLIAPLLFALGLGGEVDADWASGTCGKALYVTVLTCIGVVNNLVNATGAIECACKLSNAQAQGNRY